MSSQRRPRASAERRPGNDGPLEFRSQVFWCLGVCDSRQQLGDSSFRKHVRAIAAVGQRAKTSERVCETNVCLSCPGGGFVCLRPEPIFAAVSDSFRCPTKRAISAHERPTPGSLGVDSGDALWCTLTGFSALRPE